MPDNYGSPDDLDADEMAELLVRLNRIVPDEEFEDYETVDGPAW